MTFARLPVDKKDPPALPPSTFQFVPCDVDECSRYRVGDLAGWCLESLYIGCYEGGSCEFGGDSQGMTNNNWFIEVWGNDKEIIPGNTTFLLNRVEYGENGGWPNISNGYSAEFTNTFLYHPTNDGGNWKQSCNVLGSPGAPPYGNETDPRCNLTIVDELITTELPSIQQMETTVPVTTFGISLSFSLLLSDWPGIASCIL